VKSILNKERGGPPARTLSFEKLSPIATTPREAYEIRKGEDLLKGHLA